MLALQGDVAEHEAALRRVGAEPLRVRLAADLDGLDGLILPGGESTTIGLLARLHGLLEPLRAYVAQGRPVWGTCAGLIFLARDAGHDQALIGAMDIHVDRNAFGPQVFSSERDLDVEGLEGGPLRAVFIRAPAIRTVGPHVKVLATLPDGKIVAARQDAMLVTSFHPEIGGDDRMHAAWVASCGRSRVRAVA